MKRGNSGFPARIGYARHRQPMSSTRFYNDLSPLSLPLPELLQDRHFCALPDDWHVVLADIRNSTAAVRRGAHNDVNLVAVGALVAAINVARAQRLEVPFFFGGDGGILLVPDAILKSTLTALHTHNANSQRNFGLELHVGSVPVREITAAGHYIRLAKSVQGAGLPKAVLVGDGLLWAESRIKKARQTSVAETPFLLDMKGLECRWDRVRPPRPDAQVVCYLVEAVDPADQLPVYRQVLQQADAAFGDPDLRNPLSLDRLKLQVEMGKLRKEMLVRWGRWKPFYLLSEWVKTALGALAFRYGLKIADLDGERYLHEVISNADTLTINGRINTIIAATAEQHVRFLAWLQEQERAGSLVYGHHTNAASVMTCYIEARAAQHMHFVDGSDGGYTAAATELKEKLRPAA